jgi:hypothetical protein
MLAEKSHEFALVYRDAIGQHDKPARYEIILALWSEWQIARSVPNFADCVAHY